MPNEKLKEFLKELKESNQIKDFTVRDGSVVLDTKRDITINIPMNNPTANASSRIN